MGVFLQIYLSKVDANNRKPKVSHACLGFSNYSAFSFIDRKRKGRSYWINVLNDIHFSVFHFYLSVSPVSWLGKKILTISFINFKLYTKL